MRFYQIADISSYNYETVLFCYVNSFRVAKWLSQKYRTLVVPMWEAQNIDLLTYTLSGITIICLPDNEPKHRTVRLHTGHRGNPK